MKIGYLMQAGVPNVRQIPPSGPANHVKKVFCELKNLGHQLRLIAFLEGKVWKSDDLESFEPVILDWFDNSFIRTIESVVRRVQSELDFPYAALFESVRFAQACSQELSGYDLFYERMGWVGYGGGLAANRLGIPLVFEVNGDHLSEMEMLGVAPRGVQLWLSTSLMQWAINQASFIIATGEGWQMKLIDRWGVKPELVEVVENGSEFVSLLERGQLRAFQNSADQSQTVKVIYLGAFEPWHGVTILIKAFAKAIAEVSRLRLVVIGSGTEKDHLQELVHDLGLEDHVILTGYLSSQELAIHLSESDIGVSPYCGRVEYSGLKLLDYMAAGLAIIASGENGQPTAIQHGRTGLIIPPCDEDVIADAIISLANNDQLRQNLGRQARYEAENSHSWKHTANNLEKVINQVLVN